MLRVDRREVAHRPCRHHSLLSTLELLHRGRQITRSHRRESEIVQRVGDEDVLTDLAGDHHRPFEVLASARVAADVAQPPTNIDPSTCLAEPVVLLPQSFAGPLEDGHCADNVTLPIRDRAPLGHQPRLIILAEERLGGIKDAHRVVELAESADDERQAHLDTGGETSIVCGEGPLGGDLQGLAGELQVSETAL